MAQIDYYWNAAAIYAGPSPATGYMFSSGTSGDNQIVQLIRAKSYNYNVGVTRQDINILGKLARLDAVITDPPTVGFTTTCDDINANNLSGLGCIVDGTVSMFSGYINGTTDDRNMFVLWTSGNDDAVGSTAANNTFAVQGFGNAYLNSYRAQGAVGGTPVEEFGFEALNYRLYTNRTGQASPAINFSDGTPVSGPTFTVPIAVTGAGPSAIQPGSINVVITADANTQTGLGVVFSSANIQSYNIGASLAREDKKGLGTRFSKAKRIRFPAEVTCAIGLEPTAYQTGSLATLLCNDTNYQIKVTLDLPVCPGATATTSKIYTVKGAKLATEDGSVNVGSAETVNINFTTQISDAGDNSIGVFCSGIVNS